MRTTTSKISDVFFGKTAGEVLSGLHPLFFVAMGKRDMKTMDKNLAWVYQWFKY